MFHALINLNVLGRLSTMAVRQTDTNDMTRADEKSDVDSCFRHGSRALFEFLIEAISNRESKGSKHTSDWHL